MSISVVQSLAAFNSGGAQVSSQQSGAFGSSVTGGNTLLVFCWLYNPGVTVTSVTDTAGNTYTKDAQVQDSVGGSTHADCEVWRSSNVTGGSSFKVTINATGSAYISGTACEVSGLTNSGPLDGSGSTSGATSLTTSQGTGNFSTTNANDLIVASLSCSGIPNGTLSDPSGYTSIGNLQDGGTNEDGSAVYKIVSATLTNENPSFSWSGGAYASAIGLAYKASAGGGVSAHLLPVLGVGG
jgi:hypothetical protein